LTCLTKNQNRVVSLREIATSLWDSDYYDPQTIRVYIGRLRTKLGDDSEPPQLIRSYRGMGYMFSTAEGEHPAESE
jgi:DNA-binding response OmpR family regulator